MSIFFYGSAFDMSFRMKFIIQGLTHETVFFFYRRWNKQNEKKDFFNYLDD